VPLAVGVMNRLLNTTAHPLAAACHSFTSLFLSFSLSLSLSMSAAPSIGGVQPWRYKVEGIAPADLAKEYCDVVSDELGNRFKYDQFISISDGVLFTLSIVPYGEDEIKVLEEKDTTGEPLPTSQLISIAEEVCSARHYGVSRADLETMGFPTNFNGITKLKVFRVEELDEVGQLKATVAALKVELEALRTENAQLKAEIKELKKKYEGGK
jgi:hypothetical protein